MNYQLTNKGRNANPRAKQNIQSWTKLKRLLEDGPAPGYLLHALVQHHDHPAGGNAFIEYVLGMGWIEVVRS